MRESRKSFKISKTVAITVFVNQAGSVMITGKKSSDMRIEKAFKIIDNCFPLKRVKRFLVAAGFSESAKTLKKDSMFKCEYSFVNYIWR